MAAKSGTLYGPLAAYAGASVLLSVVDQQNGPLAYPRVGAAAIARTSAPVTTIDPAGPGRVPGWAESAACRR